LWGKKTPGNPESFWGVGGPTAKNKPKEQGVGCGGSLVQTGSRQREEKKAPNSGQLNAGGGKKRSNRWFFFFCFQLKKGGKNTPAPRGGKREHLKEKEGVGAR